MIQQSGVIFQSPSTTPKNKPSAGQKQTSGSFPVTQQKSGKKQPIVQRQKPVVQPLPSSKPFPRPQSGTSASLPKPFPPLPPRNPSQRPFPPLPPRNPSQRPFPPLPKLNQKQSAFPLPGKSPMPWGDPFDLAGFGNPASKYKGATKLTDFTTEIKNKPAMPQEFHRGLPVEEIPEMQHDVFTEPHELDMSYVNKLFGEGNTPSPMQDTATNQDKDTAQKPVETISHTESIPVQTAAQPVPFDFDNQPVIEPTGEVRPVTNPIVTTNSPQLTIDNQQLTTHNFTPRSITEGGQPATDLPPVASAIVSNPPADRQQTTQPIVPEKPGFSWRSLFGKKQSQPSTHRANVQGKQSEEIPTLEDKHIQIPAAVQHNAVEHTKAQAKHEPQLTDQHDEHSTSNTESHIMDVSQAEALLTPQIGHSQPKITPKVEQHNIEPDKPKQSLSHILRPNISFKKGIGVLLIAAALFGLFVPVFPRVALEASYAELKQAENNKLALDKTKPLPASVPLTHNPMAAPDGTIVTPVNTDFAIVIPSVGINAPVIAGVNPLDRKSYEPALKKGVAHAKTSYLPGQNGTTYLFSHSTNYEWFVDDLNAVFYNVKNLEVGEYIIVFYEGKRFVYEYKDKKVVSPKETQALIPESGKKQLILQTCWPPGSVAQRLLLYADLVEEKPVTFATFSI